MSDNKELHVCDSATGNQVSLRIETDQERSALWHPHNPYLLSTYPSITAKDQNDNSHKVIIWDATNGKELVAVGIEGSTCCWSPDGLRLAIAGAVPDKYGTYTDYGVQVWQIWE